MRSLVSITGGAILLGCAVAMFATWSTLVPRELVASETPRTAFGPHGPESPRMREQLWIVPGADERTPLRATVFKPDTLRSAATASDGISRYPLVVINHGSDGATREAVGLPIFYVLSKWFVDRGYVVILPQRRGHGATGGDLVEGRDTCADPDHIGAGIAAADDIEAVVRFMAAQQFIDSASIIVAGVSTGGWGSLALASRSIDGVRLVVNFAGGRGGHAYGEPTKVCARDRLIEAAGSFGRTAKTPTLWLYAANDSYFDPELARAMASSWNVQGGRAELRLFPAFGSEGHDLAAALEGPRIWSGPLAVALANHARPPQRFTGVP